jgi:uncharacterized protein (TIGR02145 family)
MNFITFTKLGRTLLLAAVGAVCWFGCGDDNGANSGGGGGSSTATVKIGNLNWMEKNLNVKTVDSWCYGNKDANCNKYGRLYTWYAAKSACQSNGMRLPSDDDWDALVKAVGGESTAGKKLKAKSGWDSNSNGTDSYGFSALPGGFRYADGRFDGVGSNGLWWTSTEYSSSNAYLRGMYSGVDYVAGEEDFDKGSGYSVRCIKD